MFNSSQIIIPRGTFNVVNRDQYNITYNDYLQPDALPRFSPEDRWKTELYQEYNLVRTGDVNLLETIYENAATEYEYEDGKWAERKATRVVSVAHLGNGWGRTRFLSVQYTGPDARKIFKTDCLTFSRIKHVNIVQLHAFNDSKNGPMLFFHDELIPLAHVIQNHPGCRYALERYIALQDALMFPEPPFNKSWTQVWIRAKDGTFVYGPDGPSFDVNHLDFSHDFPKPELVLRGS
ncbi:hypothetical protein L218DRAFT_356517 [Marasmius fiardii PR-910]|nr:hypothetical protein L218DRAFT_356517 [Marasmius fiardii PR-910]